MKNLRPLLLLPALGALLALSGCSAPFAAPTSVATTGSPPAYGELLGKYVTPQGVRYADWHGNAADRKTLEEVTDFYASSLPPAEPREAALAWHLNAYNAFILRNVLDKYPTKGPLDGDPLFFHGRRIVISGKKTSFDSLEQKVIRPTFKEPRIHFALNCASLSCPPLNAKPFAAETLKADLDRLTREFINGPAIEITGDGQVLRLSRIFDWYAEDFGGANGVKTFINQYRAAPLPATTKVEFMDYDWSLNEAK